MTPWPGFDLINHPEFTPEHYGLGMVVGNPEVSLLQLAAAYACYWPTAAASDPCALPWTPPKQTPPQSFLPRPPLSSATS